MKKLGAFFIILTLGLFFFFRELSKKDEYAEPQSTKSLENYVTPINTPSMLPPKKSSPASNDRTYFLRNKICSFAPGMEEEWQERIKEEILLLDPQIGEDLYKSYQLEVEHYQVVVQNGLRSSLDQLNSMNGDADLFKASAIEEQNFHQWRFEMALYPYYNELMRRREDYMDCRFEEVL